MARTDPRPADDEPHSATAEPRSSKAPDARPLNEAFNEKRGLAERSSDAAGGARQGMLAFDAADALQTDGAAEETAPRPDGLHELICHAPAEQSAFAHGQARAARELDGAIDPHVPLPRIARGEHVALVYDGTLEGLASALYTGVATHCAVDDVYTARNVQPRLGQRTVDVQTSIAAALRVRRTVCRNCGASVWDAAATASASDKASAGRDVYRFCVYALRSSRVNACARCAKRTTCTVPCARPPRTNLLGRWADPVVAPVLEANRYVAGEAEHLKQFLRFEHTDDDLWFASCAPSCNAVPFVMHHFARRFNDQRCVIYDRAHGIAGLAANGRYELVRTDELACPPPAAEEASMQRAWKRFYKALSIDVRYNPEVRRGFMPVRLWKDITELKQAGVGTL